MKRSTSRVLLFALLALSVASIAWAAQPAVPSTAQPADGVEAVPAPAPNAPVADTPANTPIVPSTLDTLLGQKPVEAASADCRIYCTAQRYACRQACGYLDNACINDCYYDYLNCISSNCSG